MSWIPLDSEEKLNEAISESANEKYPAIAIFKHSTRCSISSMAKSRLENGWDTNRIPIYYLDLLNYRNLSNQVAEDFNVQHESPQILLLKNKKCVLHQSHNAITPALMNEVS